MDLGKGGQKVFVCERAEKVETRADSAGEKNGVLRNDGETTAEGGELDCGYVDSINQDFASAGVEEAE